MLIKRNSAKLIADAFATNKKCGVLPSEVLKQRDEMVTTLEKFLEDEFKNFGFKYPKLELQFNELINQIKAVK